MGSESEVRMTEHPQLGGNVVGAGQVAAELPHERLAWGTRVVELLGTQRDLYVQLDRLSQAQAGLVSAEDADGLLGVLGEREQVMERVLEVNATLEPFRRRWGDVVEQLDEPARASVNAIVAELETLTRSIAERDEADRRAMEARRAEIAGELGVVNRKQAAMRAYGSASGPGASAGPRYEDRQG